MEILCDNFEIIDTQEVLSDVKNESWMFGRRVIVGTFVVPTRATAYDFEPGVVFDQVSLTRNDNGYSRTITEPIVVTCKHVSSEGMVIAYSFTSKGSGESLDSTNNLSDWTQKVDTKRL